MSIIAPELEDGFNLNEDDEYLNQQFSRRKDSQFVESSKKMESRLDTISQGLGLKIEKIESSQDSLLARFDLISTQLLKID